AGPSDEICPRLEYLPDRDFARPVEHHAERALRRVVLHDQHNRAPEVGVPEHWCRVEPLTCARFGLHSNNDSPRGPNVARGVPAGSPPGRAAAKTADW